MESGISPTPWPLEPERGGPWDLVNFSVSRICSKNRASMRKNTIFWHILGWFRSSPSEPVRTRSEPFKTICTRTPATKLW
jgi:hypothetical protein